MKHLGSAVVTPEQTAVREITLEREVAPLPAKIST